MAVQLRRILWRLAEVIEVVPETPRTKSLLLEVPEWEGHKAGQHVDVRLTAEDGYQAQRSYSIASAPEDERLMLTVDHLDDGEVSIYLTDVLMAGDKLELRGPIGGYFTWEEGDGGPLFLVGGGSGIAPLMAMIRHRAAAGSDVPTRLLYSSRSRCLLSSVQVRPARRKVLACRVASVCSRRTYQQRGSLLTWLALLGRLCHLG